MDYSWAEGNSGLAVPYQRGDEATIAKELRDYDSHLRLIPQGYRNGQTVYKVFYRAGPEHASVLFTWADEQGNPLPLSSAIVEKVKMLDKNSRYEKKDPDTMNEALRASRAKEQEEEIQSIIDDWMTREGRSAVLPRSQRLRQARSRTGYHDVS